jgi:hypothetical protein
MANGLARAGWDLDFAHGESREIRLATIMNCSKVEVKSDGLARRTGRIFIETSHKGNPSGINVTESQHWAIEIMDDTWLIVPTDRLLALVTRARLQGLERAGGDYNTTTGVTIPIEWFTKP